MTQKKRRATSSKNVRINNNSRLDGPDHEQKSSHFPNDPNSEELLRPSHSEAKTLCGLAAEIKTLAPWQWMEETDVFGVEDPDTGEFGFVSIMGSIGEYEAVSVYLGAKGLYGFIDLQNDPDATADRLAEIPQVQLSFSEPEFFERRDRELLKGAGIKFTGTKPLFRSFRPGFLPWFITLKESRLLIHALSQTMAVTTSFLGAPPDLPDDWKDQTDDGDSGSAAFLVRVARKEEAELVWEDQIKQIAPPKVVALEMIIDGDLLDDLKNFPRTSTQVEADLFLGPAKIGKPNERPRALYLLMLAERQSGMLLGVEGLSVESSLDTLSQKSSPDTIPTEGPISALGSLDPILSQGSLDAMYATVPQAVAQLLWQRQVRPKQILVRSGLLLDLLEPLEQELKLQLRQTNTLPAIDEATDALANWMETGEM